MSKTPIGKGSAVLSEPPVPVVFSSEQFRQLLVSEIEESPTNPRRRYDAKKMEELVQSVRTKGVIQPGIARPHPKPAKFKFQIVVGSRRYRASKEAGRDTIPMIVRDLDDDAVEEIQIIENADREDIHPLEEAEGYLKLSKRPGYTNEVIAEKIGGGHTAEYVAKRIQLTHLIPALQEDFFADLLNIGHAQLLCRLPADKQAQVRKEHLYETGRQISTASGWINTPTSVVSVGRLDAIIKAHIFLDLTNAPWKKDDALLLPKAGSCTACTKRTGAHGVLFDELKKGDNCLDDKCFALKTTALLVQIEKNSAASGVKLSRISTQWQPDKALKALGRDNYKLVEAKKCPSMVSAVFVDGPSKSQIVQICVTAKCKIHFPSYSSYGGGSNSGPKASFWEVRARKLDGTVKIATRRAIVEAIVSTQHKWQIPHDQLAVIARTLNDKRGGGLPTELIDIFERTIAQTTADFQPPVVADGKKKAAKAKSFNIDAYINAPKGTPYADLLPRIVTGLALAEYVKEYNYLGDKDLDLAAASHSVDAGKIRTELGTSMRTEFNAKRKASEARKAIQLAKEKAKAKKTPKAAKAAKAGK